MTTVSSHEARWGFHTLSRFYIPNPREEPCGTVVCTGEQFGWSVPGASSGCRNLRGCVSLLPSPGAPSTPPTHSRTSLPRRGHPSQERMPGAVRCITAVRVKPRLSTRGPRADVCVWAPGLRAPEPASRAEGRGPWHCSPAELSCPSDVDRALVEDSLQAPSQAHTRPHASRGCDHAPVILIPHPLARANPWPGLWRRWPSQASPPVHRSWCPKGPSSQNGVPDQQHQQPWDPQRGSQGATQTGVSLGDSGAGLGPWASSLDR